MSTEMPFDFLWCYEPEDDDEAEHCNCLLLGTPETVTPLHIDISNLLSDRAIRLHPIEGVIEADPNHYHFKLAFESGILANSEKISIDTPNWSLYQQENDLYLLWLGEEISLNPQQATEVILTGVAAQSAARTTTTNVTISWQFKRDMIDIINVAKIPGQNNEYATNTTLTLEMIKTSGKSNIPLYVGFVGANKVMNTHNEVSSLQLRITNTNLPGIENPDITFHYSQTASECSQLVIVLEVGDATNIPWALGTKDQVNSINISIAGEQWQKKGDTAEIKVGDTVKALQWTFVPKSADVVLSPQETLLINLNGIQTAHPTGEANLYLRYQYIEGYKDGQFTCQIEKAPLVFDDKVRIGTTRNLNGLLTVKDGISLDGGTSEIQHVGPFTFHSDVDGNGDGLSAKFCKGTENTLLMELTSGGNLNLNQGDLNFSSRHGQRINLWQNKANGIGLQSYTTYFRTSRNFAWFKDGDHNDDEINPGENGIVQMVINNGNVGIGTASPSAKLDVYGSSVIRGDLDISNDNKNAMLTLHCDEGNTLKLKAQDIHSRITFSDDLLFDKGDEGDTKLAIKTNGNVGIGTNNPSGKLDIHNGKIRINGGPVIEYQKYTSSYTRTQYQCSNWFAAVVGFFISTDKKREWAGFRVECRQYDDQGVQKWLVDCDIQEQDEDTIRIHVLFIRKVLF